MKGHHLLAAFALAVAANIVAKIIVDQYFNRPAVRVLSFPTASTGCSCGGA